MNDALSAFKGRIYHTHLKNGMVGAEGEWRFFALDRGLTDYGELLPLLRDTGYDGYLSLECLGPDAQQRPRQTAARDLAILSHHLDRMNWRTSS